MDYTGGPAFPPAQSPERRTPMRLDSKVYTTRRIGVRRSGPVTGRKARTKSGGFSPPPRGEGEASLPPAPTVVYPTVPVVNPALRAETRVAAAEGILRSRRQAGRGLQPAAASLRRRTSPRRERRAPSAWPRSPGPGHPPRHRGHHALPRGQQPLPRRHHSLPRGQGPLR